MMRFSEVQKTQYTLDRSKQTLDIWKPVQELQQ